MKKPARVMPTAKWPGAELWPLERIKEYENNPRTHPSEQITLLAEYLKQWGPDQPIVVDEDGVILKGHGRLRAAVQAGLTAFPVFRHVGLSKADKLAIRIGDNQIAALSDWQPELLRVELGELRMLDYNLDLLGFDVPTLAGFIDSNPGQVDPEETPPLPKNPIVKKGDLWILGRHRLLCGDCTNADDVGRALDDAKPQLMVTDPPYGVDYDPTWRADSNKWKGSKVKIGGRATGKVSNDGIADWRLAWALFSGDVAYSWHGGLRSVEQAQSLKASGFIIRSQIIWNKGRLVIGRGDYHWQHEACWYAVRKGKNGHWNGNRTETTVWDIAKPQSSETGHSTQKPVECMRRPIQNSSRAGEWVYDPFVGSGTTIIAAEMTGRRCAALEIDPLYCQVTIERWQKFTGEEAALDGVPFNKVAHARRRGR